MMNTKKLTYFLRVHPEYFKILKYLFGLKHKWCRVSDIKKYFGVDDHTWREFTDTVLYRNGCAFLEYARYHNMHVMRSNPANYFEIRSYIGRMESVLLQA